MSLDGGVVMMPNDSTSTVVTENYGSGAA
jgi:hypothetical protein